MFTNRARMEKKYNFFNEPAWRLLIHRPSRSIPCMFLGSVSIIFVISFRSEYRRFRGRSDPPVSSVWERCLRLFAALRGETEATKRRIAMNQNIHIILRLKIRINTWMKDRIFLHTRWDPVGGASNHFILLRVSKMCTYSVSATSVVQANRHDLFTKKLHAYPN